MFVNSLKQPGCPTRMVPGKNKPLNWSDRKFARVCHRFERSGLRYGQYPILASLTRPYSQEPSVGPLDVTRSRRTDRPIPPRSARTQSFGSMYMTTSGEPAMKGRAPDTRVCELFETWQPLSAPVLVSCGACTGASGSLARRGGGPDGNREVHGLATAAEGRPETGVARHSCL